MFCAILPSTRLIQIVALMAAAFVALACVPGDWLPTGRIALLASAALLLSTGVDLWRSRRDWRSAPLRLRRRLPRAFAIGVPITLQVDLENDSAWRRRGEFHEYADPSLRMQDMPIHFDVGPKQRALLPVQLTPQARGLRRFEPAQIRLRSHWGLLDFNLRIGADESSRVFPNFAQQARFAWLAGEQRLPSAGIKAVQRRGAGTDFDQLVDYQAGDPIRHIDWKATRKRDRPIVRKFRDERDQSVMILLDCGRRMRADDSGQAIGTSHFDQALNAVMLLAFVALSHGDAVGAITFGNPEGLQKRFAPRKGRAALNSLMAALADVEPTPSFSDYERAALDLMARQHKRSLVVIVTNSRDEDAIELSAALRLLRTRHLVVFANLREQIVATLAAQPLTTPAQSLECAAALDYTQARETLMAKLSQHGVASIDCEPQHLAVELVNRYTVLKRSGAI